MRKLFIVLGLLFSIYAQGEDVDVAKIAHPRLVASDAEFKTLVKTINRGKNIQLVRMHEVAMAEANKLKKTR